jgi:hypothetical protein
MLDRQNNDFFRQFIDRVVHKIGVLARHQLADPANGLRPAEFWKQDQILQRVKDCRAHFDGGTRTMRLDEVRDASEVFVSRAT